MTEIRKGQKWRYRQSIYVIEDVDAAISISGVSNRLWLKEQVWIAYRSVDAGKLHFQIKDEFINDEFELVEDVDG